MTVIRSTKGPFTNFRVDVLQDSRLSFQARGLYCFLVTLPPETKPTPRWLATQTQGTVERIRRVLRELEACGYVEPTGIGAPRVSIPLKLRYQALRRDGYACRYCGARAPQAVLVVDHVLPVALSGRTELENLITACDPCNTGKSDATPESWLVEEVKRATAEWLAADGGSGEDGDAEKVQPRGRGHVIVQVCR